MTPNSLFTRARCYVLLLLYIIANLVSITCASAFVARHYRLFLDKMK